MDQGLMGLKGSDLVPVIHERKPQGLSDIIFVANTGGVPDELETAGCYSNFDKGRTPQGIERAINRLNRLAK